MAQATLKTIAEEVGVAPSTVSRVLKGDKKCYISKRKETAILETVKKLNYSPNWNARNLALGRNSNIGFVICKLLHLTLWGPFTMKCLEGIQNQLSIKGFILSLIPVSYQNLNELEKICSSNLYAGLIFGKRVIPKEGEKIVSNSHLPCVVLDDSSAFLEGLGRITTDEQDGITQAIAHLKQLGHQKIAFYGGELERTEMFHKALLKNNLTPRKDSVFTFPLHDVYDLTLDAYRSADHLLENRSKFTAVLCGNDFIALGLCQRLRKTGIDIGKDISIVGFDDIEELLYVDERRRFLTTVHRPQREMGEKVTTMLLEMLETHERIRKEERIPSVLVVRNSTGPNKEKNVKEEVFAE